MRAKGIPGIKNGWDGPEHMGGLCGYPDIGRGMCGQQMNDREVVSGGWEWGYDREVGGSQSPKDCDE